MFWLSAWSPHRAPVNAPQISQTPHNFLAKLNRTYAKTSQTVPRLGLASGNSSDSNLYQNLKAFRSSGIGSRLAENQPPGPIFQKICPAGRATKTIRSPGPVSRLAETHHPGPRFRKICLAGQPSNSIRRSGPGSRLAKSQSLGPKIRTNCPAGLFQKISTFSKISSWFVKNFQNLFKNFQLQSCFKNFHFVKNFHFAKNFQNFCSKISTFSKISCNFCQKFPKTQTAI